MKASLIQLALTMLALLAVGTNGWTFSGIFSGSGLSGTTCLDTLMTRYGPLLYKCSMKCGRERYDMENGAYCLIPLRGIRHLASGRHSWCLLGRCMRRWCVPTGRVVDCWIQVNQNEQ